MDRIACDRTTHTTVNETTNTTIGDKVARVQVIPYGGVDVNDTITITSTIINIIIITVINIRVR